jgi:hypothetical protein
MLPCASLEIPNIIISKYGHHTSTLALKALFELLPKGREDWIDSLKEYPLSMYAKLIKNKKYFLDKTPRYHLIWKELYAIFPEAKYIILYRDPRSIFASYLTAMRNNELKRFDHFSIDLEEGPSNIVDAYRGIKNSYKVSYEELVKNPKQNMSSICKFLEIDKNQLYLESFNKNYLDGPGDKNINTTSKINDNTAIWKDVIDSPVRKRVLKNYIKKIDDVFLNDNSFEKAKTIKEINDNKIQSLRLKELLWIGEEKIIRKTKNVIKWKNGN